MKIKVVGLIAVLAFLSIAAAASTPLSESPSPKAQVVSKTKATTKHAAHRTKRGGKWVYTKTRVKTRPVRQKTWRTGRKVVSRTKKIFS